MSINYKGESTYNTLWGAFLSISEKLFILVVAVLGLLDLFAYKDPSITQYQIEDNRKDDKLFNFAEH